MHQGYAGKFQVPGVDHLIAINRPAVQYLVKLYAGMRVCHPAFTSRVFRCVSLDPAKG